jgi:hypothetical protein
MMPDTSSFASHSEMFRVQISYLLHPAFPLMLLARLSIIDFKNSAASSAVDCSENPYIH